MSDIHRWVAGVVLLPVLAVLNDVQIPAGRCDGGVACRRYVSHLTVGVGIPLPNIYYSVLGQLQVVPCLYAMCGENGRE